MAEGKIEVELNPHMALDLLAAECYATAAEKGFHQWDYPGDLVDGLLSPETVARLNTMRLAEMLALIHSEVSEALEELRSGHAPDEVYEIKPGKLEGFGPELADILIRVLDVAVTAGVPIGARTREKMAYNKTRPHMHGKAN